MNTNEEGTVSSIKKKLVIALQIIREKIPIYWNTVRSKTVEVWNSGTKGKVICIGVAIGILWISYWMFGGSGSRSSDDAQPGNQQNQSKEFKGTSPIKGLMGYKLGEVFTGELGNPAIFVGADWYCVTNRAQFHGYSTCIKVLPKTKKICAIHVSSTEVGIDIQTELSTVEAMLRKKYKNIEFQRISDIVSSWSPKEGSCVLFVGLMRHPMGPCVKIEVHDVALEQLVEKEKGEILQERGRKAAEQAGDVL